MNEPQPGDMYYDSYMEQYFILVGRNKKRDSIWHILCLNSGFWDLIGHSTLTKLTGIIKVA